MAVEISNRYVLVVQCAGSESHFQATRAMLQVRYSKCWPPECEQKEQFPVGSTQNSTQSPFGRETLDDKWLHCDCADNLQASCSGLPNQGVRNYLIRRIEWVMQCGLVSSRVKSIIS